MRSKSPIPQNKLNDIDPIIDSLSKEQDTRLDEITAVIVVAEAADEFPQHIVHQIIDLPLDKRQLLLSLVCSLIYTWWFHVIAGHAEIGLKLWVDNYYYLSDHIRLYDHLT